MITYQVNVADDGDREWRLNGIRHREDGPAVEHTDGYKSWWLNGERHREDGPAVEDANGSKQWWLNGVYYTQDEFNAKINPVKEMTVADIERLLGYPVKVVK